MAATTRSSGSNRGSSKGEETRGHILRRAFAMASTVGLEGLTIGNVAKAAGMSKSGVFAHFSSKEDLQLQVLQTAVERFTQGVTRPIISLPRGVPRIRAFFDNWMSWARSTDLPGGCVFIAAAIELDDRPGPLRDYFVATQREAVAMIEKAARIAVAEGQLRADLDIDQFAHEFYSIILAFHHFDRLFADPAAATRARRSFEGLMERSADEDFINETYN